MPVFFILCLIIIEWMFNLPSQKCFWGFLKCKQASTRAKINYLAAIDHTGVFFGFGQNPAADGFNDWFCFRGFHRHLRFHIYRVIQNIITCFIISHTVIDWRSESCRGRKMMLARRPFAQGSVKQLAPLGLGLKIFLT